MWWAQSLGRAKPRPCTALALHPLALQEGDSEPQCSAPHPFRGRSLLLRVATLKPPIILGRHSKGQLLDADNFSQAMSCLAPHLRQQSTEPQLFELTTVRV